MLVNITIHKRKEVKAATHPTHDLVASDEKYENKVNVGSMWTRVTQDNQKFLSGTLSKKRTHDGVEYPGYILISTKEYDELLAGKTPVAKVVVNNGEATSDQDPF